MTLLILADKVIKKAISPVVIMGLSRRSFSVFKALKTKMHASAHMNMCLF